jgi:subtilisin-like proprotein convertase family protein
LNLRTNIQHTFAGDLDITIQSPAGTVVTVTTDNGGGNDNVFDGTLWDDSANPSGLPPYGSNNGLVTDHAYADLTLASPLAPEEALSAFVGENPNGTWTITISDDQAGDGGSLNGWSVEVVTFPAPVVAAAPQTFTQSTAVAIPTGPAVVLSDLAVSGLTQRICGMRLTTSLTHSFANDIDASLTSPAGTVVTLSTDNGAANDNVFVGTSWDVDANPTGQVPYVTNNGLVTDHAYANLTVATPLVAEESFGAFFGQEGNGTWTLTISDDLAGDGGSLNQWSLEFVTCTCNNPPTIAYNPVTGADVAFTGVTTIGTIGNGSITATPSGGLGSGAAATTTINTCTLGGANPGAFAGAAAVNLSFVGNVTTPQNIALTCTSLQTVQTATLTCNETRGSDPAVQRQWPLTCPAGTPIAPTIAYNPTTGTNVAFTGVTTIGTTGNASIAATPSGGIGTGAGATTTVNGCTFGGANPGAFGGAAAVNLSFVGTDTTPQNLPLTCTAGAAAQTATLTCNESRGGAAPQQRQWPLSCPAGSLLQLTSTPAIGATVNLNGAPAGPVPTSTITVANPNPIAVSMTCTAPAFPFTVTPLNISIPAGGSAPVTVGLGPVGPGNYTGSLSCSIAGSPQVLTYSLAGTISAALPVPAIGPWSLAALMLTLMGFAGLALRRQA